MIGWLVALVLVLLLPLFLGKYSVFLLSLLAVYALVSLGLNLLMADWTTRSVTVPSSVNFTAFPRKLMRIWRSFR